MPADLDLGVKPATDKQSRVDRVPTHCRDHELVRGWVTARHDGHRLVDPACGMLVWVAGDDGVVDGNGCISGA